MDYGFTQKELNYLDDVMPEFTKRRTEDGDKDPESVNHAEKNFNDKVI
jgi:hypothetical protein